MRRLLHNDFINSFCEVSFGLRVKGRGLVLDPEPLHLVQSTGLRASCFTFRVKGEVSRANGAREHCPCSGFKAQGIEWRVESVGCRVWGVGCRF